METLCRGGMIVPAVVWSAECQKALSHEATLSWRPGLPLQSPYVLWPDRILFILWFTWLKSVLCSYNYASIWTYLVPVPQLTDSVKCYHLKALVALPLCSANSSFSSLTDFDLCIWICTYVCVCLCVWCPSGILRWDTTAPTHPSFWWAPSWICGMTKTRLKGCETRSSLQSPTHKAWPWPERLVICPLLCVYNNHNRYFQIYHNRFSSTHTHPYTFYCFSFFIILLST